LVKQRLGKAIATLYVYIGCVFKGILQKVSTISEILRQPVYASQDKKEAIQLALSWSVTSL